jgi:flagellar hook assembly protein FlgD
MRYGILVALAVSWLLVGATCFPLIDLDQEQDVVSGTTLAVAVIKPSADREVPQVSTVEIEWTAANLTGSEAVVTILVRGGEHFEETILEGGLRLSEVGSSGTVTWDTKDFEGGVYRVVARIEAGGDTEEATAPGRITINASPTFDFTEPTADADLVEQPDPNDPNAPPEPASITIRWTAFDPDGDATAEIRLDPIDPNAPNEVDHESGDEITIADVTISRTEGFESLEWDGTDASGERVEAGHYYLLAVVSDDLNGERIVEACRRDEDGEQGESQCDLLQIFVPEEIELAITEPEEDETLLVSDPNDVVTIRFTLDEDDDVLIDLKVDTDENHRNGNETTILAQRLIEEGTNEGSFDWDGDDSAGDPVADGIYRIILVVNRGSGTPEIVEADGLVFRRSEEEQPLIALLEPDGEQTIERGTYVMVRWRDDDPSESATIRLTLDDDEFPNEETETEDPEIEILADRDADGDGVQDTFQYQLPADLAPDRYFIFAYIDRDDEAPFDNISVAGGHIIIENPEAGNE